MNDIIFKTFVFSFPRTVLSFISQKWGLVFIARGTCKEIEWSRFSTRSRTLDLFINSVIISVLFNIASPDKHTKLGLINVFVKRDSSLNPITLSVGSETKKMVLDTYRWLLGMSIPATWNCWILRFKQTLWTNLLLSSAESVSTSLEYFY